MMPRWCANTTFKVQLMLLLLQLRNYKKVSKVKKKKRLKLNRPLSRYGGRSGRSFGFAFFFKEKQFKGEWRRLSRFAWTLSLANSYSPHYPNKWGWLFAMSASSDKWTDELIRLSQYVEIVKIFEKLSNNLICDNVACHHVRTNEETQVNSLGIESQTARF